MKARLQTLVFILALVASQQLSAQTADNPVAASISGLALNFNAQTSGQFFAPDVMDAGVQIGAQFYLSPAMDLAINTSMAPSVHFPESTSLLGTSLIGLGGLLRFKLNNGKVLSESAFFAPYFMSGFGIISSSNRVTPYIPLGAGMKFQISPKFNFQFEASFRQSLSGSRQHLAYSGGISFVVPTQKKFVPQEHKSTPKSQPAVAMTSKKPVVKPKVIQKKITPQATASAQVDTDGDGIPDEKDSCPELMGLIQNGGCPSHSTSPQPTTQASTARAESNKNKESTPIVAQNTEANSLEILELNGEAVNHNQKAELDFSSVYFNSKSDILNDDTYAVLDQLAEALSSNPAAILKLKGHTDNIGDNKENLVLSIKRAFNVKYYLVNKKGIKLSRIKSEGAGDSQPYAENSSLEGRKLNRRVDLELFP